MYSLILSRMASLVRPLMSTYLIAPSYSVGRNFVERVLVLVEVVVGVERLVRQPPLTDVDEVLVRIGHVGVSPFVALVPGVVILAESRPSAKSAVPWARAPTVEANHGPGRRRGKGITLYRGRRAGAVRRAPCRCRTSTPTTSGRCRPTARGAQRRAGQPRRGAVQGRRRRRVQPGEGVVRAS